jgi:site-specific DNA-methyltransferase (adenine-specific)
MKTSAFEDLQKVSGGGYEILYADPPWKHYGDPKKDQAAGKHYDCMTVPEMLEKVPIRSIMAPASVLFCWATCPMLDQAIDLIRGYGLHYRGVARIWVKTRADGGIIHGQGVRPSFVKPTTELLLVASTNRKGRTFKILTESMGQVVLAPRPAETSGKSIHSAKPTIFRDDIVRLLGDRKRVELFGREEAAGWDVWGNQIQRPPLPPPACAADGGANRE